MTEHGADGMVDAERLEEHELTQEQAGRIVDMFLAHAPSGSMGPDQFGGFLLEGFAYSLFSHEAFSSSCQQVRRWIADGALARGISQQNSVLLRTFEYFDAEAAGALRLKHVLDGIEKVAVGTFGTVARFLFFVTDLTGCGSIGAAELDNYYCEASALHLQLALNIGRLERPALLAAGVERGAIEAHLDELERQLDAAPDRATEEAQSMLAEMECEPGPSGEPRVGYRAWLGGRELLPGMYSTMLALCDGLVYWDDRTIRPTLSRASAGAGQARGAKSGGVDVIESAELAITAAEAGQIVEMFLGAAAGALG